MKSIILGAFILSIFFAVAQSISVSQHHSRFQYKEKTQTNATASDSAGTTEYVNAEAIKAGSNVEADRSSVAAKIP